MDYKKTNAPLNTVTRDMIAMSAQTGNVYETVCVIGKRANQISAELKKELEKKLQDISFRYHRFTIGTGLSVDDADRSRLHKLHSPQGEAG